MFFIDSDMTIHLTRGDVCAIEFSADNPKGSENELYIFKPNDLIRLRVFAKKKHDIVVLVKDVLVESETTTVDIYLDSAETKIGELINKPVDYWYEIELNPDTIPQTLLGYDEKGAKIFRLYPEGGDKL